MKLAKQRKFSVDFETENDTLLSEVALLPGLVLVNKGQFFYFNAY